MSPYVERDRTWIRTGNPGLVIAGSPPSLYRIADSARAVLEDPAMATVMAADAGASRALDMLVGAGAFHRCDPAPADPADLVVAVPAFVTDDESSESLRRCVAGLAPLRVVVVDDGSTVGVGPHLEAMSHCRVLAHRTNRGPAAARNTALSALADGSLGWTARLVCFVDADVTARPEALLALAGHLGSGTTTFAAPRIVAAPTRRWLERYEGHRGALDMGPWRSRIRHGSRVPYVPTATLVVDLGAARDAGGFDEELRTGEDVDFVWRLGAGGTTGVYDPSITVDHRPRPALGGFLRQRFAYGASSASLARRHGPAVAPWRASSTEGLGWFAIAAALVARGAPSGPVPVPSWSATMSVPVAAAGTVFLAATAVATARGLGHHGVDATSGARFAMRSLWASARRLGIALTRTWWPIAVLLGIVSPWFAATAGAAFVVLAALDWAAAPVPGVRRLDPVRFIVARAVDHLAHGSGSWWGALRAQRPGALAPAVARRRDRSAHSAHTD